MKVHYPKLYNMAHLLALNVLLLPKDLTIIFISNMKEKVQVGKDQEKAQSEKDSHSKNRGGKKNKPTIKYLYHENIS